MPTGYSAQNSRDQSLNNSGAPSGAANPMLPPKKIQRNEISLAAPATAIEVASDRAIVVESSGSDRSSIHSSSSEQNKVLLPSSGESWREPSRKRWPQGSFYLKQRLKHDGRPRVKDRWLALKTVKATAGFRPLKQRQETTFTLVRHQFSLGPNPCRLRERRCLCHR